MPFRVQRAFGCPGLLDLMTALFIRKNGYTTWSVVQGQIDRTSLSLTTSSLAFAPRHSGGGEDTRYSHDIGAQYLISSSRPTGHRSRMRSLRREMPVYPQPQRPGAGAAAWRTPTAGAAVGRKLTLLSLSSVDALAGHGVRSFCAPKSFECALPYGTCLPCTERPTRY